MSTFLLALPTTELPAEVLELVLNFTAEKKANLVVLFVLDSSVPQTIFQRLTDIGFVGEKPGEELKQAVDLEYRRQAEELLAEVKKGCSQQQINCQVELVQGAFAEEILQAVATHAADLLILIRQRRSLLSRLFANSAIEHIIYQAPCEIKVFES